MSSSVAISRPTPTWRHPVRWAARHRDQGVPVFSAIDTHLPYTAKLPMDVIHLHWTIAGLMCLSLCGHIVGSASPHQIGTLTAAHARSAGRYVRR